MSFTASRMYLGIDPSLTSTGLAFIGGRQSETTILIKPGEKRGTERLAYVRDTFLESLLISPERAAIEGPSLYSVNRADDLGQIRGMFLLFLYDQKIPTTIVPPSSLKKYATGNGGASKERMIEVAKKEFGLPITSDDLADALWLAHLARGMDGYERLTRKQTEVIHGIRNPKTKRNVGPGRTANV